MQCKCFQTSSATVENIKSDEKTAPAGFSLLFYTIPSLTHRSVLRYFKLKWSWRIPPSPFRAPSKEFTPSCSAEHDPGHGHRIKTHFFQRSNWGKIKIHVPFLSLSLTVHVTLHFPQLGENLKCFPEGKVIRGNSRAQSKINVQPRLNARKEAGSRQGITYRCIF